jgi:hypothetical protein
MAGLDPAIHLHLSEMRKSWMGGSRPPMVIKKTKKPGVSTGPFLFETVALNAGCP